MIFNSQQGGFTSDSLYYARTLDGWRKYRDIGGDPDDIGVWSWYEHPSANYPEYQPFTMTYTMRAFIQQALSNLKRAKYEPPDGRVYHGVGWNYKNSIADYLDMMPDTLQPLFFQATMGLPGTRGMTVAGVLRALSPPGIDTSRQYVELGIHFKGRNGTTDSLFVFTSTLDRYIDTLAVAFKKFGKPFFFRIAFEINGAWNGYSPWIVPGAFRKLVRELRNRNVNNFATIWCYEPDAAADFADSTKLGWKWYPGDDVVDWFGLDVFDANHFNPDAPDSVRGQISAKGKSELFLAFARSRNRPVYLAETTARKENLTPDARDPDSTDGRRDWEHWFEPFFAFIQNHPEIKAFNYINLDWTAIPKWSHWGDCRLQINSIIRNNWIRALSDPRFLHAGYDIEKQVRLPLPAPVLLRQPRPGAVITTGNAQLTWFASQPLVSRYHLQVATDRRFGTLLVNDSTLTDTTYMLRNLQAKTTYYWRVRAANTSGWGMFSAAWHFQVQPQTPKGYWGLRNINLLVNLPDSAYDAFNPRYYAWPVSWNRIERRDDVFEWKALDAALDFTSRHHGKTVLVLNAISSWATGGEPRAPDDLVRNIPLSAPVPVRGYSLALYDFTYKLVEHIATRNPEALGFLRFFNEPHLDWKTTRETFTQDVEDYIRCLRTVYLAAHAAANDYNTPIMVSHGGFSYAQQLQREWFLYGERHPDARDSLLILYRSRYERQFNPGRFTWDDFRQYMSGSDRTPGLYWADAIAGQTDWMDWFDVHYHWKPRFIFQELRAFENVVRDSGGVLKPWLAAEAAMNLSPQGKTPYNERFHAGDMVRKWTLGMAFGLLGICTPVVGYPPDRFFGLYSPRLGEYLSAGSYRFLRSLIEPAGPPQDISTGDFFAFRFNEKQGPVDVVWKDVLFDPDSSKASWGLNPPDRYNKAVVYDVIGKRIGEYAPAHGQQVSVSQEPVIIVWKVHTPTGINEKALRNQPTALRFSLYPNPSCGIVTVSYDLPDRRRVSLSVVNVFGSRVLVQVEGEQNAGNHTFNLDTSRLPRGMYFVMLRAGEETTIRKLLIAP